MSTESGQKRLLVAGAGANQIGIYQKATELGIETVATDGNPAAPGFAIANHSEAVNIVDEQALLDAAERWKVAGVYPAAELSVEAAAFAATELGLAGISPWTAVRVRDKFEMREALARAGIPNPGYSAVSTEDRLEAESFEYPVIVKPADANSSKGVHLVESPDGLAAALESARTHARRGNVLLEAFMDGPEFCVDGIVYEGRYILGGITGKAVSLRPYRFDTGIHIPASLTPEDTAAIESLVRDALRAIEFGTGTTHAEVILTGDGPRIVEIAGRPGGGRIPTDLIHTAYGFDFMADSLRIALGEPPREVRRHERGAALYWFPANPGPVLRIEGIDEARAMPGVRDIEFRIKPGDVVHARIDCIGRDEIGYVFTEGDTVDEAISRAKRVLETCRVVTHPAAAVS